LKKVTHTKHVHSYRNNSKYEHNQIGHLKCGQQVIQESSTVKNCTN